MDVANYGSKSKTRGMVFAHAIIKPAVIRVNELCIQQNVRIRRVLFAKTIMHQFF